MSVDDIVDAEVEPKRLQRLCDEQRETLRVVKLSRDHAEEEEKVAKERLTIMQARLCHLAGFLESLIALIRCCVR